jgi:Uma2 family endonuclease
MTGAWGRSSERCFFRLPLKEALFRNRRPDVAYVSFARWPSERAIPVNENDWDVVPDLVIEVTSPHDLVEESLQEIDEYFQVGVQFVWVVYPELRRVYVYESPKEIRVLANDDTLDGGTVLPGFQLRVDSLFDPIAPAS